MAKSIKVRGFELSQILSKPNGALELILTLIDTEQRLETAQETLLGKVRDSLAKKNPWNEFPDMNVVVEIEEFADNEDRLINNAITEDVWIDTLCLKTGLDVRAILGDLPKELGLYAMKIAYKQGDCLKAGCIKVWVMPVKS